MAGPSGGFFGGLSEGIDANRSDAATNEQLRIMNERQKFAEGRQASSDASTNVTNTLEFIKEYATNLRAAGNDENKIAAALKPFIESVRTVAPKAGLDPDVVAHRALMVATVPQQTQEGESHQVVKVSGGLNQPDRLVRVAKKGGSVVPLDPTTFQPMLGESDTITPRQAQVANAPMMPQAAPVQTAQLNTFNDRFNAAQGGVPVAPQAPMTAPGPDVIPTAPASGRNEAYLQKIPNQELRGLIKGIADYDIDVKSLSARAGERRQALMMVKEYDPNFNMADYNSIVGVKKAFTSGVEARNLTSLGTIIGHIGDLASAGRALDNFKSEQFGAGTKAVNAMRKWMLENKQDPRVKDFETAQEAVATELDRAFRGSTTAVATIEGWKKQISSAQSPEEMKVVATRLGSLLGSRVKELIDQYERIPGPARSSAITMKMDAVRGQIEKIAKGEAEGFVGGAPKAGGAPQGVDAAVWGAMTPEERALWK
jgi:hypothetical protein